MASFMGKDGVSGPRLGATSSSSFNPRMTGDYLLASYSYRDEKADVSMEIGRMTKLDDCKVSYSRSDDESTWGNIGDDILRLRSIKVTEDKGMTFAFYRDGEQILIKGVWIR